MRKEIKAYMDSELKSYHQSENDLAEIKDDIREEGKSISDSTGICRSGTSNMVESKTVRLMYWKRPKLLSDMSIA